MLQQTKARRNRFHLIQDHEPQRWQKVVLQTTDGYRTRPAARCLLRRTAWQDGAVLGSDKIAGVKARANYLRRLDQASERQEVHPTCPALTRHRAVSRIRLRRISASGQPECHKRPCRYRMHFVVSPAVGCEVSHIGSALQVRVGQRRKRSDRSRASAAAAAQRSEAQSKCRTRPKFSIRPSKYSVVRTLQQDDRLRPLQEADGLTVRGGEGTLCWCRGMHLMLQLPTILYIVSQLL